MHFSSWLIIGFQLLAFTAPAKAASKPAFQCPTGISAKKGDAPLLTVAASEQMTLMVCGHKDAQGKIKIHLSEFEILSRNAQGKTNIVETGTASQDFRIWDENQKLMVEEVVWFSGGWTPIFHSEISCVGAACKKSAQKCAFDKEAAIKHQAQRELKVPDWDAAQKKTQDPSLLDSVSDAALTGSDRAINFFMNPSKDMRLSKEAQKRFTQTQTLLKRLLAAKCL
jgi:hypothetical protein